LCGLKSPGSRLRPPFYGDVTFFYTVTAPPRPRAPPRRGAVTRSAAMRGGACAAPPAQRRLRLACAAPPAQRCLCRDALLPRRLRRNASRRDAARGAA